MFRQSTCAVLCALTAGTFFCLSAAAKPAAAPRQHDLLDAGWMFHRGDIAESNAVSAADYDDTAWQHVDLPHDYILDGVYDPTNSRNHGYLPFMPAWYRKHFTIPQADQGRVLQLEFGGVFRDSEVWLNGKFLGRHPSGYTPFLYDITQAAVYGGENVLTVRVDPTDFEGWWYEGGGIYRHVYLNSLAPVHVAQYGTQVISVVPGGNNGADGEADLTINTTVENNSATTANYTVVSEILGPNGKKLATLTTSSTVPAAGQNETGQTAVLPHPKLWSLESPQLYQLRTTIRQAGRTVDTTTTTFGIRTIHYDADKGFFLNGKHVEICGVACHQDLPAVGIAVPDSLEEWRVRQLKQAGANGWRTAHNPPNEEVLAACDRLGMLVMDENRHLGDTYRHHSLPGTPATNLTDLATMIQRDRNHPSIIMWSMCNEEPLQGKPEGAAIFTKMMDVVHQYDRTRPITCAMNAGWLTNGIADVEDIIGVNYSGNRYAAIHKAHPDKPMFASETVNNKTARSEYEEDVTNGWSSSYNLGDSAWIPVGSQPFMSGLYEWTGFDYKGEPNPNGWPDVSNNTGILDCCGFPKDKDFYLKSWWTSRPMVHLMPIRWNWPAGKNIRVLAFSNAKRVELFLNGKSLGAQDMPRNGHLEWQVPYQPGRLMAAASTDGKVVAMDMIETVGAPASLLLSPDRRELHADGRDTLIVPVSILDADGKFVSDAGNRVSFQLLGGGKILGVANGNPADHDPDRATTRAAFNGHCIAVIQSDTHPETLQLIATAPGLAPAAVTFKVR